MPKKETQTNYEYANTLDQITQNLVSASRLPYNTAQSVYDYLGIQPKINLGGSCVNKVGNLVANLPPSTRHKYTHSRRNGTNHIGLLVFTEGGDYYLDPFHWQSQPLVVTSSPTTAETLRVNRYLYSANTKGNPSPVIITSEGHIITQMYIDEITSSISLNHISPPNPKHIHY